MANGCAAGGALTALLGQPRPEGDASASWTFAAPAGTSIVRFAARRATAGLSKSVLASDLAYILETDTATLEKCAPSTESSCIADLTEPVSKEGLNGSWVRFRALCTNAGDACSSPLRVDATQVNVGLKDLFAPTVSNVKLLDDGDRRASSPSASTPPTSVAACTARSSRSTGRSRGRRRWAGRRAPTRWRPTPIRTSSTCRCRARGCSAAARAEIDVRALSPGAHGVELAIEDAAGNETAVYGPTEFPRANGTNASTRRR